MRTGRILGSYAPAYSLCCSAQELDGAARGSWISRAGRSHTRKASLMLPNFEALFGLPPHHRLFLVRSRGRGGPMWGEYWTHEEINECGSVIARYESCEELNARVRPTGVGVNTTPLAISWMCRPTAQAGWSGREGRLRSHASSQTAEQMVCRLHAYSWAAAGHLNQVRRAASGSIRYLIRIYFQVC